MKTLLIILFVFLSSVSTAQFRCPKDFHLVPGENGSGDDDIYTNGKYAFDTHKLFREYDYKGNDAGVKKFLTSFFGFPFTLTKDGFCWGTGQQKGFYCYVIVTGDAEVIELYAKQNDKDFAFYSNWLLSTARAYKKNGRSMIFPMHGEK